MLSKKVAKKLREDIDVESVGTTLFAELIVVEPTFEKSPVFILATEFV